ncbi:hypothetical protein [Sandaracinus amylolyticus]|uniref:hypothetical protein n=1 Tax=Sandaracinus amylolyticus TaxID=927083 RepID=UPI001F2E8698|nr:hypothetical protein [Sandaracinus amylolyticus]UJR83905.1 Hypothetical protein I5071_59760 [Sandaracinus amylolyticus]
MDVERRRRSRGAVLAAIAACLVVIAAGSVPARAQLEVGIYEGVPWPIIAPPLGLPIPAPPRPAPSEPATPAAARVMEVLRGVQTSMRQTRYQHATVVREREGVFLWDCSGMAAWVLRRAAPRAMGAITRERPVARDFVSAIERAPVRGGRSGWQRLEHIDAVRPGDVFAWRRPRGFPSRNTGHVGFVMEAPVSLPSIPGAYAVRIADSTSWGHQEDTRRDDGVGGFGFGTLVFLTDGQGHATHYGWVGTLSDGYVITPVVFGRLLR